MIFLNIDVFVSQNSEPWINLSPRSDPQFSFCLVCVILDIAGAPKKKKKTISAQQISINH